MAQIDIKPKQEQVFNGLSEEHRNTLNKMIEIQDILLNDPPNDKRFKRQEFNYMLEYIDILTDVQYTDYSDEYITNAINNLYDKIFKHRRY